MGEGLQGGGLFRQEPQQVRRGAERDTGLGGLLDLPELQPVPHGVPHRAAAEWGGIQI